MKAVEMILPVLIMLLLGRACKKWNIMTQGGIDNIKGLVVQIMLPVAIFHALATAEYSIELGKLVGIMFIMLLLSFGLGFVLRPLMNKEYRRYLPFMVSVYEGGMMAYPLYTSLCGQENLAQIAVLDIAGLLFGFSIYMGLLRQTENGEKLNGKKICTDALRSPVFIATVIGIVAGLTGCIKWLVDSPWGGVYTGVENTLTTAVTPLILLVVGYSIELTADLIKPCLKTIFLRVGVQALMLAMVLWSIHHFIGDSKLQDIALITYMSAPATFSMQTFLKDKKGNAYVSTTNSLYCLISILVYIILAAII